METILDIFSEYIEELDASEIVPYMIGGFFGLLIVIAILVVPPIVIFSSVKKQKVKIIQREADEKNELETKIPLFQQHPVVVEISDRTSRIFIDSISSKLPPFRKQDYEYNPHRVIQKSETERTFFFSVSIYSDHVSYSHAFSSILFQKYNLKPLVKFTEHQAFAEALYSLMISKIQNDTYFKENPDVVWTSDIKMYKVNPYSANENSKYFCVQIKATRPNPYYTPPKDWL